MNLIVIAAMGGLAAIALLLLGYLIGMHSACRAWRQSCGHD